MNAYIPFIKALIIVATTMIGFALVPSFTTALANSTTESPPHNTRSSTESNDFKGYSPRILEQQEYSLIVNSNKHSDEKYSYAWLTLNVPYLFFLASDNWEAVLRMSSSLFMDNAYSQYKTALKQQGFEDFAISNKGRIISFLATSPRLLSTSIIGTQISKTSTHLLGRRWVYKAIVHSTYLPEHILEGPVGEKDFLLKITVVYSIADDTMKIEDFQMSPLPPGFSVKSVLYPTPPYLRTPEIMQNHTQPSSP